MTKDEFLLFVLSGPEPQRTIFEQMIFAQVEKEEYSAVIVRGLPLNSETPVIKNAIINNHLSKEKLENLMQRARFIFCRSGYSSVMDINAMMLKSILIPTPGQTEQEYLGKYLMEKGFAVSGEQKEFRVRDLLSKALQFNYDGFIKTDEHLLSTAIDDFLQVLCKLN
ncbi:glycosyltransferase [Niabella ginsengisoli]|uniref:Glycosyl transferase family 28 C-terminal domain-containing protein n=1 Tax=Niabella ginsengisoli TaxID=522298 RepID=A0ABS9SQ15_9BACT|nr:glycosyltransferase [Niabella ginsengisoli]MCH5600503.1 hypothetical protein [Niabella ginsengisoli]